jgi:hypothetical protein
MTRSRPLRLVVTVALVTLVVAGSGTAVEPTADYDAKLDSGRTVWQGQTLSFDGSLVVAEAADDSLQAVTLAERNFSVHPLRDDGTLGQAVATVTLDSDGVAVVRTAELAGRYVLVYDGNAVAVDDGHASLRNAVAGANLSAHAWTVTREASDVEVRFDGTPATDENETVRIHRRQDARLSGEVDLPTGTDVTFRLHNGGSRPVLFSLQTELGPDGRFEERLDLTAVRQGTSLNVSVAVDGQTLATTTAVVGDSGTVSSMSSTDVTRSTSETSTSTWATVPGFSLVGAVGALLVVTVALAVRRGTR